MTRPHGPHGSPVFRMVVCNLLITFVRTVARIVGTKKGKIRMVVYK